MEKDLRYYRNRAGLIDEKWLRTVQLQKEGRSSRHDSEFKYNLPEINPLF